MTKPGRDSKLRLVKITWRDAYFRFDSSEEERDDYLVETCGFLLGEDDSHFIVVAGERLPSGDWRAISHIPKECVIYQEELIINEIISR